MPERETPAPAPEFLPDMAWLEQIADRFEDAWRNGTPPCLADFLSGVTGEQLELLLSELVKIDLEHRWKSGDRRTLEAYSPELAGCRDPNATFPGDLVRYYEQLCGRYGASSTPGDSDPALKDTTLEDPITIGKYRVIQRLGRGGQANVYRCIHPTLGRDVVVKLGHDGWTGSGHERAGLLSEGRILAELDHPHLVRVHDFDFDQGRPFLVMDFMRGCNLKQHAERCPLSPRQAATLVAQAARALAVVHDRGIVHKDLKPHNILVDESGQPRILDFGLARVRNLWAEDDEHALCGTLAFMPPEQARGEKEHVGARSDIFGLGAVLYYLLTGQAPFHAATGEQALARARACDVDAAALETRRVPGRLQVICHRALAPKPADRYARAADLAADLERFAKAPKWTWAAAALVCFLAIAGMVWWFGLRDQKPGASMTNTPEIPAARQPVIAVINRLPARGARSQPEHVVPGSPHALLQKMPLTHRDQLVLGCDVPRGYQPAIFFMDGAGRLSELLPVEIQPSGNFQRVRYPAKQAWSIDGSSGTIVILVCANRERKPELQELSQVFAEAAGAPAPWPTLPPSAVLLLHGDGVEAVETARPLGETPFTQVWDRLEKVHAGLRKRGDFVVGVAAFLEGADEEP